MQSKNRDETLPLRNPISRLLNDYYDRVLKNVRDLGYRGIVFVHFLSRTSAGLDIHSCVACYIAGSRQVQRLLFAMHSGNKSTLETKVTRGERGDNENEQDKA